MEQEVAASPATVEIGYTVTIIIPFQPPSSVSLLGDIFVLGPRPEGNTVASFKGISYTPDRGAILRWTIPQRDSARRHIATGSYGLRMFVRDPKTWCRGTPALF